LEQLFDGRGPAEGHRGELLKLAAQLIVEEALEEVARRPAKRWVAAPKSSSG
jgi:hypothetical protein